MEKPEYQIREMLIGDVSAVASIESCLGRTNWNKQLFRGEFDLAPALRYWLIAALDNECVGFGGISYGAEESHILNVGVAIGHQRKGLARLILKQLLEWAAEQGASTYFLDVEIGNTPAISLYESFGFEEISVRADYYGRGRDALVMHLQR